ncbi:MAG TPA: P-loop NTPase [Candidatus Limnocylindria bacterium]|nr:P-loop NTPase [Candidatus Limnocylindria bacterium]
MQRPTVLLAMGEDTADHSTALDRAGFDVLTVLTPAGARPDLAVIDCDLPEERASALYDELRAGDEPVPTLLVFGENIPDFATASAAGFDEYAVKPVPTEALVYRLQALMIRGGQHMPTDAGGWTEGATSEGATIGEAHVISVFAPKGGVGKTTVAVNLAVALRQQTRSSVLLFDADVGVGNVTSVLAAPYRLGLADLADSLPEEWTDSAFEHATTEHPESGVRVLTWGTDPGESERVSVDLLLAAMRWGRTHHSYVVVDNHPGYDDRTMAMLSVSNEIFLVVTPEVGPLRNSAQFLDLAREVGLRDSVKVIVNRANHGVRVQDIEQALKLPVSATIVSNGPKAVIASNEGSPIISRFPKEKITTDLHNVARLVTDGHVQASGRPARRPWWSSLVSRASNASNA